MLRRNFHRLLLAGLGASLAMPAQANAGYTSAARRLVRPPRLKKGDTVALVAPGSPVSDAGLQQAVVNLESLGMQVKWGAHARASHGYLAGDDTQRLADLHTAFSDPTVKAVWCLRGGYGCTRLLPNLNFGLIRRNPKILVGYSDVTALLNSIHRLTGLVTFHGPGAAAEWPTYTRDQLVETLFDGRNPALLTPAAANQLEPNVAFKLQTIREGRANGPLVGGNLSLLQTLVGTPYAPDLKGKILFLEDVGEKPYRLDRMLTHLRQVWPLHQLAGIALGIFNDCQPGPDDQSLSLPDTLADRLGDLGVPVLYGLSFGHIAAQFTLPLGVNAGLDTQTGILSLLQAGVS